MTSQPARGRVFLIPLAALVAVLPLILHGCSCGHDFDFHLLTWMEAARQFSHGNLHPHWAFSPAFNAGEPRFVFYPPLSWYLGALLGLLLTHLPGITPAAAWTAAPILFTWIALTASGFTMHRLARSFTSESAAQLAATLYLANPYLLFTAFERSAYGELLAAAWIPLLLHSILRDRVSIPGTALPVALLWLTNVPAAILGSYALALLAASRMASTFRPGASPLALEMRQTRHKLSLQLASRTLTGFLLGLALAAFYLIPASYQRRFVQIAMATIADLRIDHNFLFEHTGTSPDALLHDQVLHSASLIAVLLLGANAALLVLVAVQRMRRSASPSFPVLPLAVLIGLVAFLLTPLSSFLWSHAPEAAFLQFPWRLLLAVAPVFALAAAFALDRLPIKLATTSLAAIGVAAALTIPAYHLFRQPCDPADTAPARLALFQSSVGADPTDEYTPTNADNDALKPNNPPYWLDDSPTAPAPASTHPGSAPMHLGLVAPHATNLILNLRDYPAWRITLNGAPDPTREPRPDGLIAIPIPAGPSTLGLRYAHTFDQLLGDAVSLLAFVILAVALRSSSKPRSAS
jgi:hypothetical protein